MASPELGSKQVCPNCQAKFYDLGRRPATCPKCHTDFDPDEAVRNRRTRVRAAPVEQADDDREDQVAKSVDGDEDEDEESVTPALDEGVDDVPLVADDDDDAEPGAAAPDDELAGFSDEDDLEDDEDDAVPFLEEEDDDFDDSEIDGLPTGDDDDR